MKVEVYCIQMQYVEGEGDAVIRCSSKKCKVNYSAPDYAFSGYNP